MPELIQTVPLGMTVLALLLLAGACSSKLSSVLNVPVLLVFLAIGMAIGTDGFGFIDFGNAGAANIVGTVAMAFILFSGGYDTRWSSVKKVIGRGALLSTLGVLMTAVMVGAFCRFALGFSTEWSLLLGAIISSTDAAAVFAILRSRSVSLGGKLQPLLEFESGSNDPMAAFLTLFLTGIAAGSGGSYWMIFPAFLVKMSFGVLTGIVVGKLAARLFNIIDLEYDGLYYVLSIGVVLLTYGGAELLGGNGFMAVYVAGLVMGNSKFIYQHGVGRFHDGLGWLMQLMLFGMLGLLVFPSQLPGVAFSGMAISLFLMLVARPAMVFCCLAGSSFTRREKIFTSWVGLRGGAPIMLATFPLMAGVNESWQLFNIVFFTVLTSVIVQGKTLMPLAKLLKLDRPLRVRPRVPLEFENTGTIDGDMVEFEVSADSPFIGKSIAELGLPAGALILLIRRGRRFDVPTGTTRIQPHDGLMILAEPAVLAKAEPVLAGGTRRSDGGEGV